MRKPAGTLILPCMMAALLAAGESRLPAQTPNRLWFVTYNGSPTPSSDVSVQSLSTDGSATGFPTGAASVLVSQTNFPAFNSPYDVAVDAAMGKAYVLDNNLSGATPEYIYSFNLAGTPAQIAASGQVIYTMPVPAADVTANLYPLISGLALDPINHLLYFNQIDVTTGTNSFIGRLDVATSSLSNTNSTNSGNPALHQYYVGQVPGQGAIAVDTTNVYLGAINRNGNAGVFTAPRDGTGAFSELVTLSSNDTTFANGLMAGVAADPQDHLIYYLTGNAGIVNLNFSTNQDALWSYDLTTHTNRKIAAGYRGFPGNIAVDATDGRYYFTLGRDATGNAAPTNYQAVYTGNLGSTNAPTLFYVPGLSGQDVAGQANAGNVVLQGIFVQNLVPANAPGSNRVAITRATNGWNILFTGTPGQNYVVQSANAAGGTYGDLSGALPANAVGVVNYLDQALVQKRFYRVRTGP